MAYAEATDIADRLGRDLDDTETRIVGARLNDVELLIKSRIKNLDAKVTTGEIDEALVVMVEADAVLRLIRNPEGYTSETDGNYAYEIDARVASGRLSILDEEWALLGVRASVFTIAPRMSLPTGCFEGEIVRTTCAPDDHAFGSCGCGCGGDDDDTAVWA